MSVLNDGLGRSIRRSAAWSGRSDGRDRLLAVSLTFSPDGRHVAGVLTETRQTVIFDVNGDMLTQLPGSPFAATAQSRNRPMI
jgi:hypothetical protein